MRCRNGASAFAVRAGCVMSACEGEVNTISAAETLQFEDASNRPHVQEVVVFVVILSAKITSRQHGFMIANCVRMVHLFLCARSTGHYCATEKGMGLWVATSILYIFCLKQNSTQ